MKLKYLLTALMALSLPLSFIACEPTTDDDGTENVDPNKDPDTSTAKLLLSKGEVSYNDFTVKVDNSAGIDLYIIEAIRTADYEVDCSNDPATAAAYVLSDRFGAGVDLTDYADGVGMEPLGKYPLPIFDAADGMVYKASDYTFIDVNTKYTVVGFGVSNDGAVDTEITTFEVSTTALTDEDMIDVSFEITAVDDFSISNFAVDVKPSKADVNYIVGAFDCTEFEEAGIHCDAQGNPEWDEAAEEWSFDLGMWYPEGSDQTGASYVDFAVADGTAVFAGDATVDMKATYGTATLKEDYKYVVIAFAVDANGLRISEVSHTECTTAAAQITAGVAFEIEETVAPTAGDWGGYDGTIKITPADATKPYAYTLVYDDPISGAKIADMSDQEVFDNCQLSMIGRLMTGTGVTDYAYTWVTSTGYLVVFGYEDGSRTTDMTRYELVIPVAPVE